MDDKVEEDALIATPRVLSFQLHKLSQLDVGALVIMLCLSVVVWKFYNFLGFVVGLGLTACLIWPRDWNKRYYEPWVVVRNLISHFIFHGKEFEDRTGVDEDGKPLKPLRWNFLRTWKTQPLRVDQAFDVGLLHNKKLKTYSMVIGADGSDITAMIPRDAMAQQKRIAEAIRQTAAQRGRTATTSFVLGRRPYDMEELKSNYEQNLNPDVFMPESVVDYNERMMRAKREGSSKHVDDPEELYKKGELTKEELRNFRLHRLTGSTMGDVSKLGSDTYMVMVITIAIDPRMAAAEKGSKPLTPDEAKSLPIVELAKSFVEALEAASVHVPHVFTPQECRDYFRIARDVANIDEYREAKQSDTPEAQAVALTGYRPNSISVTKNTCTMDGTHFTVLRLTGLPLKVNLELMSQLFVNSNVLWVNRSLVAEATSDSAEYMMQGFFYDMYEIVLDFLTPVRRGAKSRNRLAALEGKQEELALAAHAVYFNIFLVAASTDPDELDKYADYLKSAAQRIGAKAARVTGESRQVRATLTAITGVPFL